MLLLFFHAPLINKVIMISEQTPMDVDTTIVDNKFNFHFPDQEQQAQATA